MSYYRLHREQYLPISLAQAWEFFSAPQNLKEITPPYLQFETLYPTEPEKMYAGQIITYTIRPVWNFKLFWMTEITHVQDGHYFVDEQRFGPYAFWHHTHFFFPVTGGVKMVDQVHYKLPFGILGSLAHWLFVKKQLTGIFEFRRKVLINRFGSFSPENPTVS